MEKSRKPKIRFKGYNDDWEQRKLLDIYQNIGNAFVGTATPYYVEQGHFYLESNNIKNGQINHNSEVFINNDFYERQKDKWLHTGDMVMVQSGHVGHAAVIPEKLDNSAAHALIMFRNAKVEIEPYLLNYQYQTSNSKKKIDNITTGNTIKHILASDMKQFTVDIPSIGEQQLVANYFIQLDELITLHQRKLEKLMNVKKSMLEKMFPKQGSTVPEIRFNGFTQAWEQRKAKKLFISTADKGYPDLPVLSATQDRGMIRRDQNSINISHDKNNENGYKRVLPGQFVIHLRSFQGGFAHSRIEGITSPAYTIFGFSEPKKHDSEYWKYVFTSKEFIRRLETVTYGIRDGRSISYDEFLTLDFFFPSVEEQEKISQYLDELTHLITLHQRKLEKLKNIKKSMLEKMFI